MGPSDFHDGQRPALPPPLLVDTTHHRRGSLTLPRWPSRLAAPTTSAGSDGFSDRLLPRRPAAAPVATEGRRQQGTFEACSGFTRIAAGRFAPGGFSRPVTQSDCSTRYRGEPTTPRAGLPPAGHRDPEGLLCPTQLTSDLLSWRTRPHGVP